MSAAGQVGDEDAFAATKSLSVMVGCLATAPRSRTQLPCVPRQTTPAAGDLERFSLPRQGHLRRLDSIWIDSPIYFITSCTESRRRVLANRDTLAVLREEFETAHKRYGWTIGRYVVMPDHLHFFCGQGGAAETVSLSRFVGGFKQWTAKRILRAMGLDAPLWQREFFDHLLRTPESYERKWRYVLENPVRAGLVVKSEDWPYAGEIDALFS